jgi:hypothetical protein
MRRIVGAESGNHSDFTQSARTRKDSCEWIGTWFNVAMKRGLSGGTGSSQKMIRRVCCGSIVCVQTQFGTVFMAELELSLIPVSSIRRKS